MPDTPPPADEAPNVTEVMRRRHASVVAPAGAIAEVVRRATGQGAARTERIVRGYESEVYRVGLPAGEDVVVRVRRYGSVSYASEAWAIERCRAAGAPAPEVLLLDTVPAGDGACEVMVQRAVPGRPLDEIEARLSPRERAYAWAQAGAALAAIHSVPAGGFYKMREPGVWDFPDWESITQTAEDDRQRDIDELRGRGVAADDLDTLSEMLREGERAFPCRAPALLHGDFLPDHLFFDDDLRLRGVIDFGDFQGGARIGDLANLKMSEPDVDLGWLRDGYGDQEPFDANLDRRLLLTGAELQVGYLAHFLREGNAEEAAVVMRAIRATVDAWRAGV